MSDLAKLLSLFFQDYDEEEFNNLHLYSSSIREILLPVFINDDRVSKHCLISNGNQNPPPQFGWANRCCWLLMVVCCLASTHPPQHTLHHIYIYTHNYDNNKSSGYGSPFEIYHTNYVKDSLPPYWIKSKAGAWPGYTSAVLMIPEIKLGVIVQMNDDNAALYGVGTIAGILPVFEKVLWDLQPLPANPGDQPSMAKLGCFKLKQCSA